MKKRTVLRYESALHREKLGSPGQMPCFLWVKGMQGLPLTSAWVSECVSE